MCLIELNKLMVQLKNKEDVLEDIYNLTFKKVFGYLLSISKNYDLAEDLAQDTYVELVKSISRYKDQGTSLTYLFSISKNLYLMYLRKNKKQEYVEDIFVPTAKDTLESEDELLIKSVLSILSKEEAEIVYLHIIDELKHKDIAKLVNKPLGTVTYVYNNALKKLKKFMEEE